MNFPIFEAIMMLCFGAAWPVSIMKSWKSRTNKGKSLFFMLIIIFGYTCGLVHKIWWQSKIDGVVWLYVLNEVMVSIDVCLYFRNRLIEKHAEAKQTAVAI